MSIIKTLNPDEGPDPKFDIVFDEVFGLLKRLVLAHSVCSEFELAEFLGGSGDTHIDYAAADIMTTLAADWSDITREIREYKEALAAAIAADHQR